MMRSLTSFSGGKWYQRTVTCGTVSIRGFAQRRTDNKVIIPQPPATVLFFRKSCIIANTNMNIGVN